MRYRLRFQLQEFDLPDGATIIGRSLDCNLTIEDPLVSRQHARIVIDAEGARVEDLKSRNGVRVNGVPVRAPTPLCNGDRVRVGTQDLVFCRVGSIGPGLGPAKTTGVLRLCANCRLPYPRESFSCPHCEATEQTEEGTWTGEEEHGVGWTVQLLVESLDRALALGRVADAERMVRRATARVDEHLAAGGALDDAALATVASKVAAMTSATSDPTWVLWVIGLHRRLGVVPGDEATRPITEAAWRCFGAVREPLGELLGYLRHSGGAASDDAIATLTRLECSWRSMEVEEGKADRSATTR